MGIYVKGIIGPLSDKVKQSGKDAIVTEKVCKEVGKDTCYVGETGGSLHERALEHFKGAVNKGIDNHMCNTSKDKLGFDSA